MTARWMANLILLLMLLGLGVGIHRVLTVTDSPQTLTGISADALRLVLVERAGEPRIRLERMPDGWRVREPLDLDADQDQLDRLLSILTAPVQRSFPAHSAALRELGLEPARLTLTLDNLTLGFGGLDPLEQRRYTLADGLVHLIEDRYYVRLIAPPIYYYSRRLLPRGQPPIYATLKGVPLAPPSLKLLADLRAERIEPLTGELSGEPVQVKLGDGTRLPFILSADRRHWTRPDLKLRYVLSDSLLLELDPTAVEPGPTGPPPPAVAPTAAPRPAATPAPAAADVGVYPTAPTAASDPFAPQDEPSPDPTAPLPTDTSQGAPPVVRLSPDGPHADPKEPAAQRPAKGFGAEPYKAPPAGFGVDPFAPDSAQGPAASGARVKTPKAEITPSLRKY